MAIEKSIPSQLDEQVLTAEVELELPGAFEPKSFTDDFGNEVAIEVEQEDGAVIIELGPPEEEEMDFYGNLAEKISTTELSSIASQLLSEYDSNKASRQEWEDAYADGLELLGLNYEERNEPFRGATGVTHPLLAEAATQFQAQAFNELLPPSGPVRTAVIGEETREKQQQAQRVQEFMNYYITDVMEEYTPDMDQMLFYLPLAGSAFKKVYYDETKKRAVSCFVPAENLVVPYNTSDLESCPNITQTFTMPMNDLRKKQVSGFYRDVPMSSSQGITDDLDQIQQEISGMYASNVDYDCTLLECHVDLDLDGFEDMGEDGCPTGIKIPYVVTISQDSGQVLSIRRNYYEGDEDKKKINYFVHYKFLPGFGFYGLGLIHTIGGLSRTATAALRQLIDAGTLSNLPAGFKARGLRIRDDDDPLQPGEFRDVDAPGGAIKDSLMPLPFKGPDGTLFQLLGFVVQAGQRFATITDLKVGDGNQQAAVGTTVAMLEQGSRVMSAVHKRMHYAMRCEFKLLSRVMYESLPDEYPYAVEGRDAEIKAMDFDERVDVIPVSNPNVFSQAQRIALAQTKLQLAQAAPEMHNMHEVLSDMYQALGVRDSDRILKRLPEEEIVPKDPAQENIDSLDGVTLQAFEGQDHMSHMMAHLIFAASGIVQQMPALAMTLQKHVMEHVQISAQEQAMQAISQQQVAPDQQQLVLDALTAQFVAQGLQQLKELNKQIMGQGPDPVVQLKQQELQLDAQAQEKDAQLDLAKLQLEQQKIAQRQAQFEDRLASQERQTAARIQAGMERELLKQRGS
jgi:hypothetical protein|tara:strand:+ start:66 stop:2453 length:2388 start_codon:yes stop_codon:yes gene_type:complete